MDASTRNSTIRTSHYGTSWPHDARTPEPVLQHTEPPGELYYERYMHDLHAARLQVKDASSESTSELGDFGVPGHHRPWQDSAYYHFHHEM